MTTHNGHARKITKLPICSLNQIDSDRVQVQFTQSDLGPLASLLLLQVLYEYTSQYEETTI